MIRPKESFKKEKQNEDLNMIQHSLFHACCIKYNSTNITVDKEKLIFLITDNCSVSPQKAREYLGILQARGVIDMDRELVHYKNENKIDITSINQILG
jgi:hypothetical protein